MRKNSGAAGGDGVSVGAFAWDAAARIALLRRDLLSGDYRPGPVRHVDIPKRNGGVRRLTIPCVADRVAQSAAHLVLGPVLDAEMEESSFAYRPGRSVRQAVDRVAALRRDGYIWVVDGDIERYFDSVPQQPLLARLARALPDDASAVIDLVGLWLRAMAPGGIGLPQGGPISPVLANLYLDEVDEAIEASGARLVRFADDFVILCRKQAQAERALGLVGAALEKLGLRLNPTKTRIVPFEDSFAFLGKLFVRSVIVDHDSWEPPEILPAPASSNDAPVEAVLDATPEPEPKLEGENLTSVLQALYLMQPGRRLTARGGGFAVIEGEETLLNLPHHRVDRIEIGPNAEADLAALDQAAACGVALHIVDGHGASRWSIAGPLDRRADVHLAQARQVLDPALRLDLARRLVEGRIRNQRSLLHRLNRRRKNPDCVEALAAMQRALRKLPQADSVAALMGHEGEAAAHYWPAFGLMLEHGWRFAKRRRRPPPDPVNLLLSFTAGMLHRDIGVLAGRCGLHPGFGALHETRAGHEAALSDLIEEFRAPLVEGLVAYLLNNRVLAGEHFERIREEKMTRILPDGRDRLIRAYEAWLDRSVTSPRENRKIPWRALIAEQARAYRDHMLGEVEYAPYVMDY